MQISQSIYNNFDATAQRRRNHTAVHYLGTQYSYSRIRTLADRFAAALSGMGIVAGQKPVAWWKVWLAISGLLSPGIIVSFIGIILLLFGGIGIFALGLAAVLFMIGIIISFNIYRQAVQAVES